MWAVRQWGIGKSKSGRYAYDTRTRGEWCHDCARASTRNGQRGPRLSPTHAAQCFYGRGAKSRVLGAHNAPARGANDGRCAAATVYGTVLRGATSRDRPVPTRQRQRERPCSHGLDASELRSGERRELRMRIKGEQNRESRKHTESLFPEVRGHLITVHVHVQIGRKT